MKFACPNSNCDGDVDLKQNSCPRCGLSLSLGGILRCYWGKLVSAANVKCPGCGQPVPVSSHACPGCKSPLTVESAVDLVVAPKKRRLFEWAANATPETKKRVQRMYFFLSLAILWWMLALVEEQFPGDWIKHSAIGAIFLAASGLVASILIPKRTLEVVLKHLSATTKLALVANYVSVMLAVRMFTTTWKERSLSLAGIIIGTWLAGYFLTSFAWPMKEGVSSLFEEEEKSKGFDASGPQGRKARME